MTADRHASQQATLMLQQCPPLPSKRPGSAIDSLVWIAAPQATEELAHGLVPLTLAVQAPHFAQRALLGSEQHTITKQKVIRLRNISTQESLR